MSEKMCFVIGPIGKDGSVERKHADLLLHAVIKNVLESEEFCYKVKRADEDTDPGMIGDRVISDIIHADLVVADLTDLNPNALYELGIRHSTEKPVIHIAKSGTPLPFDAVSHRTIFVDLADWQSTVHARSRLASSAHAIEDPAFQVSNPITQANASFKMRDSADPRDRVIAQIQERLSLLEIEKSHTRLHKMVANMPNNRDISDSRGALLPTSTRNLNGEAAILVDTNAVDGTVTASLHGRLVDLPKDQWEKLRVWD